MILNGHSLSVTATVKMDEDNHGKSVFLPSFCSGTCSGSELEDGWMKGDWNGWMDVCEAGARGICLPFSL